MPRGDGTGPAGLGPTTGRAAGYCAGYGVPGFINPIPGRGFWGRGGGLGRGRGWGRGFGRWAGYGYPVYGPPASYAVPYGAPFAEGPTREQELEALKGQAKYFEDAMEEIRKRIGEIETEIKKTGLNKE